MITHNIGRDISKFYYGGYSLEENYSELPAHAHTHSTYADLIVKDLAIARFADAA